VNPQNQKPDDKSPGEIAALLGISTRTILEAIRRGELPAIRYSRKTLMISTAEALAWRDRCRRTHSFNPSSSAS
jgi:excisionase family DNA binding protein